MRTLSQGKVAWIIDAMERGAKSVYSIAKYAGVTPQWVRVLWRRSGYGREVPRLRPPGRPRREIPAAVRQRILEAERAYRLHPRALEHLLGVPHNTCWRVLREAGLVADTASLHRRRKPWVRFERRFANSLWQADFTLLDPARGTWLLVFLDDASRNIVGYAVTKHPTAEVAWATFLAAAERHGFPRQVLTDHGIQFTHEPQGGEGLFDRNLRELARKRGVRVAHIHGRVKHPQTGGKVERVFRTIKTKVAARWPEGTKQFRDVHEVIAWYNDVKPHESLDWDTPAEAFVKRLRPQERKAFLRLERGRKQ